jgi:hypothetical protein
MARFRSPQSFGLTVLAFATLWTALSWSGCSKDASTDPPGTTTHAGGNTTTSHGGGGIGGATTTSNTGATGGGGAGGSGGAWPSCLTQPPGSETHTIWQVWEDNPSVETPVWVPDVLVTGVSYGGCSASYSCQLFLQQDPAYDTLALAARKAIKLFVSANTAYRFTGIAVGDRLDVYANAVRSTYGGANELQLLVNTMYPGCANVLSSNNSLTPVPNVLLTDLTVEAYEVTIGPVLVQIQDLTGRPEFLDHTFGLWTTSGPWVEAGIEEVVSVSPYCISGGTFSGLTLGDVDNNFDYVQGVFELFIPATDAALPTKYKEICARSMADLPPVL